jgi:hypothetical protein
MDWKASNSLTSMPGNLPPHCTWKSFGLIVFSFGILSHQPVAPCCHPIKLMGEAGLAMSQSYLPMLHLHGATSCHYFFPSFANAHI